MVASPLALTGGPAPLASAAGRGGLRVGVVGFGSFGQFLAGRLAGSHSVFVTSVERRVAPVAAQLGCTWVPWKAAAEEMLTTHLVDVLLIATSIVSLEEVVSRLPFDLMRDTKPLVVDVLSIKEFPKEVLLEALPEECDILCTHPMFSPLSGQESWEGLRFVFEKVRISNTGRMHEFLGFFEDAGCCMVEMSCATHDEQADPSLQQLMRLVLRPAQMRRLLADVGA